MTAGEWPQCSVEVSLLSAPKPLRFADEADLLRQVSAGEDGIILECEGRRATFLPQVWEDLPDKRTFFQHLLKKANLAHEAQPALALAASLQSRRAQVAHDTAAIRRAQLCHQRPGYEPPFFYFSFICYPIARIPCSGPSGCAIRKIRFFQQMLEESPLSGKSSQPAGEKWRVFLRTPE